MATKKTATKNTNTASTSETKTAQADAVTSTPVKKAGKTSTPKKASAKKPNGKESPQVQETQPITTDEIASTQPETESGKKKPIRKVTKKATTKNTKPDPASEKKLSALDAAAAVLAKTKEPMNAKDLVGAMAEQELWTSPNGKTPHLTLSAAIQREILVKGAESRFKKTGPGRFSLN